MDYLVAAKARGLHPSTVETWIARGILKSWGGAEPGRPQVDPDELDRVIRQRIDDPEVLVLIPAPTAQEEELK